MENRNFDGFDFGKVGVGEVFKMLDSRVDGLFEAEVAERRDRFGDNEIVAEKRMHIIWEFLSYFKNPLVVILLVAAGVSLWMGDAVSAAIIFLMVLGSVALDFFEEHSAGKAAEKLREKVKSTACVVRQGKKYEIPVAEIVAGDMISLNAGDLIPADCRVVSAKDLFVDQSALTGESFPCEKTENGGVGGDTGSHLLFFGTSVISGEAQAVVVRTGKRTEFGKVAASLARQSEKSEFEIGVVKFGVFIARIVFCLVLFIFLFNSLKNLGGNAAMFEANLIESFLFSVAIAVGVTPELLPMIMSVTMARGSMKMAKKGVIIKRLGAIPSFGGMDVLCTDKTGTLTENKIALVTYADIEGKLSEEALFYAYLTSFFETGIENPLDQALLEFKHLPAQDFKKIDELPFDFERRMMSVAVDDGKQRLLITKGGPESVFTHCGFYRLGAKRKVFGEQAREQAVKQYHRLSADGNRVLAVAVKKLKEEKKIYCKSDEADLELLGFVSFFDPPKAGVKDVLHDIHTMRIAVKIITGDNELVTEKICREVGLFIKGILRGDEIDRLNDQALQARVEEITIFSRCSPIQKNRIIRALRARNKVVCYLGDGINDAPSLKSADAGISVSNAVDVAKEAADIILTRKDLAVLKDGVIEGRKVFGNTMKYILMGLSSNFGNMFSAAGAVLFLPFLPMLPIQVLLNNFLYDLSQVTIPMDDVDKDWLQRPRRWNLQFIKKFMYFFGPISSLFDFLTFFVLFKLLSASEPMFQTAWFMESLATQVLVIHFIRTRNIPFIQSTASKYLSGSTLICLAIGWIIPFTPIGAFFKFQPLPLNVLAIIGGIVAGYLAIVEFVKRLFYKLYFKTL